MSTSRPSQRKWPQEVKIPRQEWKLGALLYGLTCEPKGFKDDWSNVFTKHRPMVVIILHGYCATVLPVYTHSGKGLEAKYFTKEEYVQVRDVRRGEPYVDMQQAPHLTPHPPLYTAMMKPNAPPLDHLSCVHIAGPATVQFTVPFAMLGTLELRSLRRLRELFRATAAGPVERLNEIPWNKDSMDDRDGHSPPLTGQFTATPHMPVLATIPTRGDARNNSTQQAVALIPRINAPTQRARKAALRNQSENSMIAESVRETQGDEKQEEEDGTGITEMAKNFSPSHRWRSPLN